MRKSENESEKESERESERVNMSFINSLKERENVKIASNRDYNERII